MTFESQVLVVWNGCYFKWKNANLKLNYIESKIETFCVWRYEVLLNIIILKTFVPVTNLNCKCYFIILKWLFWCLFYWIWTNVAHLFLYFSGLGLHMAQKILYSWLSISLTFGKLTH